MDGKGYHASSRFCPWSTLRLPHYAIEHGVVQLATARHVATVITALLKSNQLHRKINSLEEGDKHSACVGLTFWKVFCMNGGTIDAIWRQSVVI
jgi:hypothetical protein